MPPFTRRIFVAMTVSAHSQGSGFPLRRELRMAPPGPHMSMKMAIFMAMTGEDEKALPVMRITRHADTRL